MKAVWNDAVKSLELPSLIFVSFAQMFLILSAYIVTQESESTTYQSTLGVFQLSYVTFMIACVFKSTIHQLRKMKKYYKIQINLNLVSVLALSSANK